MPRKQLDRWGLFPILTYFLWLVGAGALCDAGWRVLPGWTLSAVQEELARRGLTDAAVKKWNPLQGKKPLVDKLQVCVCVYVYLLRHI